MGTGSSISWSEVYGWMTRANGSFDFLRRECVVGIALRVERTYFGGQFASGEGVTLDLRLVLASQSFARKLATYVRRQNNGRRR
jgi:hypothetical protein